MDDIAEWLVESLLASSKAQLKRQRMEKKNVCKHFVWMHPNGSLMQEKEKKFPSLSGTFAWNRRQSGGENLSWKTNVWCALTNRLQLLKLCWTTRHKVPQCTSTIWTTGKRTNETTSETRQTTKCSPNKQMQKRNYQTITLINLVYSPSASILNKKSQIQRMFYFYTSKGEN